MFKKLWITFFIIYWYFIWFLNEIYAAWGAPTISCVWLAWCENDSMTSPSPVNTSNDIWIEAINSIIWEIIQFVAVVAVISLILSGLMYLISWWEEEKTKKAKTWIIWSLIWVFLSISAWWIIGILNRITIW